MLLALLYACTATEPQHVDRRDVDMALARGDGAALCAGLKMKDEAVRELAAKHLGEFGGDSACLCERAKYDGRWDPAILRGVEGNDKDDKVGCLGTLLDDPAAPDREALVKALFKLKAPAIQARLKKAAESDPDPKVKSLAIGAYGTSKDPKDRQMLIDGLGSNPDPTWRVSAAQALTAVPEATDALKKAFAGDTDPNVRAAALLALKSTPDVPYAELGCAGLKDAAPEVRAAAASGFRATTDPVAVGCLREAMLKEEPDGRVRAAMLQTLRGSPSQAAADILCDAIPFWISTYVKDADPPREGDTDILFAQNDRDFERSLACVTKAQKQGSGWSCWGKSYAAEWTYHLGGPKRLMKCGP